MDVHRQAVRAAGRRSLRSVSPRSRWDVDVWQGNALGPVKRVETREKLNRLFSAAAASFGGIQSGAIQPRGKQLLQSMPPRSIYFLLEVRHEGLPLNRKQPVTQPAVLYELMNEMTDF